VLITGGYTGYWTPKLEIDGGYTEKMKRIILFMVVFHAASGNVYLRWNIRGRTEIAHSFKAWVAGSSPAAPTMLSIPSRGSKSGPGGLQFPRN
jgi:hypothetical protein